MTEESTTATSDGEVELLSPGIVESRNQTNRTQISAEIKDFLAGTTTAKQTKGLKQHAGQCQPGQILR